MMLTNTQNLSQPTQSLRPIFGFLRSLLAVRNILGGGLLLFGIREHGRKPSGIAWAGSLLGMGDSNYAPVGSNNNEQPADDARSRCRSHSERFCT